MRVGMEEFTKRKIESSGLLGEEFRRKREEMRLSFKDVSKQIYIQAKYLEAIEKDDYAGLPARVYTLNFLNAYARFLGLDPTKFLKRYTTELEVRDSIRKRTLEAGKPFRFSLPVTPSRIRIVLLVLFAMSAMFYVGLQTVNVMRPPTITLYHPSHMPFETKEGSVMIRGVVRRSSLLTVNGQAVYIDDAGSFERELLLSEGTNVFELAARSSFQKETRTSLTIIFTPPPEESMKEKNE